MEEDTWQRKKVCIVDDDSDLREIYLMKFNQEGFDVSVAVNGEEGMRLIREKKPDIILLDLQMPVKNGVEVLTELNADEELSRIPVIINAALHFRNSLFRFGMSVIPTSLPVLLMGFQGAQDGHQCRSVIAGFLEDSDRIRVSVIFLRAAIPLL